VCPFLGNAHVPVHTYAILLQARQNERVHFEGSLAHFQKTITKQSKIKQRQSKAKQNKAKQMQAEAKAEANT
jgi:hypothetical protein